MDSGLAVDILNWLQSVEEYVKSSKAERLDFETSAVDLGELGVKNVEAIFEFLKSSKVSKLNLARNSFEKRLKLLSEILPQTKIEKLNLKSCDLVFEDLLSLIKILNNTRITDLNLAQNKVRFEVAQANEFITHLINSQLMFINLSGNFLSHASLLFKSLPNTSIVHLNLANSLRTDAETESDTLSILFSNLPNCRVKDLNLSGNDIKNRTLKELSSCIKRTKLERLDLSNNSFDDEGVDFLTDGLINSRVVKLNLSGNRFIGTNRLCEQLKDTQIRELDLSKNEIKDNRMFATRNFMACAALVQLKLGSCEISDRVGALLLEELKFSQVTELDLSCNDLKVSNLPSLAEVITQTKITNLDLSRNYFGNNLFTTLSENVKLSAIQCIDLSSNNLKSEADDGFRTIANFLQSTKDSSVTSIGLRSNNIRPESARIIATGFPNTKFTSIDLSHNSIGIGTEYLASELKLTAVTLLDLSWNSIGDQGIKVLAIHLEETKIIELKLINNAITSVGGKALASVLGRTKLHKVFLDFNMIENDGIEALAEGAKETAVTVLSVVENPGERKLLIDSVLWQNRTRKLMSANG